MRKIALLLIIALLALPAGALADVSRGDRGEEVRYLQWLLFHTGFLFEEPDGAFGGHTEQAVKNYQKYKGYPQTGAADYALMEEMEEDRARLDREIYGPDYYLPYDGSFTPPFETGQSPEYVPLPHCLTTVTRDLSWQDTCQRHLALLLREGELTRSDDADSIAEAGDMWMADIRDMYAEWIQQAPARQRPDILAAWVSWNAAFEAQREAMLSLWQDGTAPRRELVLMAREYALTLCELRSGETMTGADIAPEDDAGAEYEPVCMQWVEGGTVYTAPCLEHAELFGQEYAWMDGGANDAQSLEDLAIEWKHALLMLYDAWMGMCDESQAGTLERAQEAYFTALTRLGAAFGHEAPAQIAELRAVEFECARLCEALKAALVSH